MFETKVVVKWSKVLYLPHEQSHNLLYSILKSRCRPTIANEWNSNNNKIDEKNSIFYKIKRILLTFSVVAAFSFGLSVLKSFLRASGRVLQTKFLLRNSLNSFFLLFRVAQKMFFFESKKLYENSIKAETACVLELFTVHESKLKIVSF